MTTCPHCLNTLKNEYRDLGLELDVVHHTQLLNRLVREGRLTPVTDGAGAAKRSITYHDPCYLGRHNQVYAPPRELLQVLPGASYVEMERSAERSFCCGAGGARMWMEENLGERINVNRTQEAVATGADQIAVGCPFCRVMLSDGLTSEQAEGRAREEVEVLDVAQMLLASVKGEPATRAATGTAPSPTAPTAAVETSEETRAEPEPGDETQTADTVTETADVGPAAKASGGSSLFDLGSDDEPESQSPGPDAPSVEATGSLFDLGEAESSAELPSATQGRPDDSSQVSDGGSLFDIAGTSPESEAVTASPDGPGPGSDARPTDATVEESDLGSGSLFDLGSDDEPAPETPPEPVETTPAEPEASSVEPVETPPSEIPEGGSLFDLAAPESEPDPEPEPEPEPEREEGAEGRGRAGRRAPDGRRHR